VEFEIRLPKAALADGIVPTNGSAVTTEIHDAFAIRYRVL
jgi:hypothetical protein